MKWNYKCHKILSFVLYGIIGFFQFFLELSWNYAHYRNGWFVTGPDCAPYKNPNTFWKDQPFWNAVKWSWKHRHREE